MHSIILIGGLLLLGSVLGWRYQAPAILTASFGVAILIGSIAVAESWPLYMGLLAGVGSLTLLQGSYLFSLLVRQQCRENRLKKRRFRNGSST